MSDDAENVSIASGLSAALSAGNFDEIGGGALPENVSIASGLSSDGEDEFDGDDGDDDGDDDVIGGGALPENVSIASGDDDGDEIGGGALPENVRIASGLSSDGEDDDDGDDDGDDDVEWASIASHDQGDGGDDMLGGDGDDYERDGDGDDDDMLGDGDDYDRDDYEELWGDGDDYEHDIDGDDDMLGGDGDDCEHDGDGDNDVEWASIASNDQGEACGDDDHVSDLGFGVYDAESDGASGDGGSVGGVSIASIDGIAAPGVGIAGAGGAAAAAPIGQAEQARGDRMNGTRAALLGNALATALVIWALIAGVSSTHMELLFRVLHAILPDACFAANLPKRYSTSVKMMAKAEKFYRGDDPGFISITVPITEAALLRKRIKRVHVIRRSIRETVSRICQNPKNSPGSLRERGSATPGEYGDVMNSPMLLRIQSLSDHVWDAAGVPEEQRLTLYTAISKDGTAITGRGFPVEASTLTIANLDRDNRNSNGNCKLLSVYRAPTLHNPTAASQKKSKYKPTTPDKQAIRRVVGALLHYCCPAESVGSVRPTSCPVVDCCSRVNQEIEKLNVDEFIQLVQNIFILAGIVGLASGRTSMSCLILPALWLGDLQGQNKLACLLAWACRRCMVRYHELGALIIRPDGTAEPAAPRLRYARDLRLAYRMKEEAGSDTLLHALDACDYARPALLDLGAGRSGVGVAGVPRGFLAGMADDWTHFGPLGIIKATEQFATLFITDSWPDAGDGVQAVRRFELRIAHFESFSDGVVNRCSFLGGFLRDSDSLLTAGERDDLLRYYVFGIGTDNLVIPSPVTRIEFQQMIADIVYVASVVKSLSINTVTLENMQRVNYRCEALVTR